MTIQEAIGNVQELIPLNASFEEDLRIVLAAARAYACDRCGGTGSSIVGTSFTGRSWRERMDSCPNCLEARMYLKEHAK